MKKQKKKMNHVRYCFFFIPLNKEIQSQSILTFERNYYKYLQNEKIIN